MTTDSLGPKHHAADFHNAYDIFFNLFFNILLETLWEIL